MTWTESLNKDPLPWLLEDDADNPGVRLFALRDIIGLQQVAPEYKQARAKVIQSGPVPEILNAMESAGYWFTKDRPYAKYRGTSWQIIFLADLGADPLDERVKLACQWMLASMKSSTGGFRFSNIKTWGPIHCFNGNVTAGLLALGQWGDERVNEAVDWAARSILGSESGGRPKFGTNGPGFRCSINGSLPCAWGAVKELKALSFIPVKARSTLIQEAIEYGAEFLMNSDLAQAEYPSGNGKISPYWFKFGYPLNYTSDILEALDVLATLGYAKDPRLSPAIEYLLSKQDSECRWKLENTMNGKMWTNVEKRGRPSKWVTLRALRVLKAAFGDQMLDNLIS